MSLQLITGRANSGKTGVAYGLLREAVARRQQAVLVLPSTPDVGRARRELALDAPLGLKITNFEGYLADLWSQRGDGRALVEPSGRRIAIAGIAAELTGSGELSRLAERCVVQLTRDVGEAWRGRRAPRGGPGSTLGQIIERYGEHLAAGELIESAEAAQVLASCGVEHPGPIIFHRFTDLSEEQRVLILGLAERSQVAVTATVRQGLDASNPHDWFGNHIDIHTHIDESDKPRDAISEVTAFAESVFAPERTLARCAAVRFCAAEGEEAQAVAIAHEVTAAVSEEAASSFDRIAVAFRDVRGHESALRAALRDAGVPAQFDVTRPLRATPLGGALVDALEFAAHGARASLLSFMRSPFGGVAQAEARALEARLRRLGASDPDEVLRQLRPSPDSVVGLVAELRVWRDRPVPKQGLSAIAQLVSRAFAAGEQERGSLEAREDADVQRAVMRLLESTAELRTQYSLADLVRGLSELRVTPGAIEMPGHLQVMPVTRLRGRRFDVVVLGGLNAGEFPATADESMLAGSAVHEVLTSFGAAESQLRGTELERMLFYEAASRARNRLIMVARTSDDEGEAALASSFLEAAFECYEEPDGEGQPRDHRFDRVYRASGVPDGAEPGARSRVRRDALEGATGPRFSAARRRAALRSGDLRDTSGLVDRAVSPSGIESYLRCPYRWYFDRVVRPSTLERGFDARDEGDYSHRLLAGTYESLMERRLVPLRVPDLGHRARDGRGVCSELDLRDRGCGECGGDRRAPALVCLGSRDP